MGITILKIIIATVIMTIMKTMIMIIKICNRREI